MNILEKIVIKRKEHLENLKKKNPFHSLERKLSKPDPFFKKHSSTLIAECKKGSPSKGIFLNDYDPVKLALEYKNGGADSISVLTEPDFFFGNDSHLAAVRSAVNLPVIRKDFIFDDYQIRESWSIGADAILLIASLLDQSQLTHLTSLAFDFGLEVLVEVHDEEEMERAINSGTTAIGINARNLKDFTVDLDHVIKIKNMVPKGIICVAESGIHSKEDVKKLVNSGFDAFLIGEHFITSTDRKKSVSEIKGVI